MSSGDPGNVIRGHKANLKNPNTSDESKEHSRQVIDEMESGEADDSGDYDPREKSAQSTGRTRGGETEIDDSGKETNRVLGGYRATLHNKSTSAEAKEHAREVLEDNGVKVD
ncbi:Conidiation protein 6-domain-containing protein [Auriculariales sp. MPI-PUGE-AT-0066]|nr:Conidiation protein 6-domain-containing protein [Auriculariales sp. MPI-PUGE-AT-0066]